MQETSNVLVSTRESSTRLVKLSKPYSSGGNVDGSPTLSDSLIRNPIGYSTSAPTTEDQDRNDPSTRYAIDVSLRPRRQLANAMVLAVADIDRAIRCHDGAMRTRQPANSAGLLSPSGPAVPLPAIVRDDPGRGIDQADRVILGIDDEHIAGAVHRHFLRRVEHRVARILPVAGIAARAGAGDGFDDAIAHRGVRCCPDAP